MNQIIVKDFRSESESFSGVLDKVQINPYFMEQKGGLTTVPW